jgi:transcriptional regulator with XRE-family HTH domain
MLTGELIRQARNLLLWQPEKLARRARVTTETIHRAESVDGDPPVTIAHLYAIQRAFEAAGVEVTDDEVKLKTESQIAGRDMETLAHGIEARGVLPTHRAARKLRSGKSKR